MNIVTLEELVAAPVVAFNPGDVNHDGVVDVLDMHLLVTAIGNHDYDEDFDVNMDGSIDANDQILFLAILAMKRQPPRGAFRHARN